MIWRKVVHVSIVGNCNVVVWGKIIGSTNNSYDTTESDKDNSIHDWLL